MEKFTPLEKNFYTVAGSDGNDKSHLCVWTLPPCGHPHQVRGRKLGARYGKVARLSNRNTCQKVLWINPATNIWSVLYAPKALTATLLGQVRWVFECFSPCTKINISHFAVKHSSFPILAHGEVKRRSVKMSDSLDFGHIHFVTQQLTFSLLFYY